jgi:hypothetical protein
MSRNTQRKAGLLLLLLWLLLPAWTPIICSATARMVFKRSVALRVRVVESVLFIGAQFSKPLCECTCSHEYLCVCTNACFDLCSERAIEQAKSY